MMSHLFTDNRQADVLLTELGDLCGAIGAALLAATPAHV
jgi:hypothetical protein